MIKSLARRLNEFEELQLDFRVWLNNRQIDGLRIIEKVKEVIVWKIDRQLSKVFEGFGLCFRKPKNQSNLDSDMVIPTHNFIRSFRRSLDYQIEGI